MVRSIPLYILLTLFWMGLEQEVTLRGVVTGFLLSVAAVTLSRYLLPGTAMADRIPSAREVWFALVYLARLLYEIALANWTVLKHVLRPKLTIKPGIVAVPTRMKGDVEVSILANSITLTPGTWTLEPSEEESVLYVHALDAGDPDDVRRAISERLEEHILRFTRC